MLQLVLVNYSIQPSESDTEGCPSGFFKFTHSDGSQHCWMYETNPMTYDDAKANCIGRADHAELG